VEELTRVSGRGLGTQERGVVRARYCRFEKGGVIRCKDEARSRPRIRLGKDEEEMQIRRFVKDKT